ncbi:MAG: glycosyltransferase family 2 protein [bacterium]|nr:glycosyltransferase family 2 protein [bacterium]
METKELTIAINGYKSPELLRLCLRSVLEHMEASPIDYEVLVTDSATGEDTETLMREEFPEVRFFPFRDNVGFKTMVNKSLAEAQGKYIFLINSDIILTAASVPRMLGYLKTHPDIGILSPKQLNFNESLQPSCFRFYRLLTILYRRTWLGKLPFAKRHLEWFIMADYDKQEPRSVDWVMGSAILVSREAVRKVGPMDKRFYMYMEDVDWCRRFWENGYRVVYYPEAFVYHYHGKGSAKGGFLGSLLFNRLTWYHIRSALQYFWKYRNKSLPSVQ